MEIAIIGQYDPFGKNVGGMEIYHQNLMAELKKKKIKVHAYGWTTGSKERSDFTAIVRDKVLLGRKYSLGLFKNVFKLKFSDDTIMIFDRPDRMLPFLFHKQKKVCYLHGSHYEAVLENKGKLLSWIYTAMEYVSLKRADIVISVSHENKRFYEKRFPWLKMEVIPVGIGDAARPLDQKKMRKELGLPLNKTIGINIGRWAPTKQVDKIVAACKGKDMQLLIAGKGNEEEKIRKAAGSNTTFLGALTHEQVIKYMNAADFFILYSKFEGLPTTVLESIACGTPVFANRVGDVPVAIEDGKNGFFINKPEDIFTRKLIPKVKNLRTSCLESAKKFRWAKVVDQILKVIQ